MSNKLSYDEIISALKEHRTVEYRCLGHDEWFKLSGMSDVNVFLSDDIEFRMTSEMVAVGGVSFPKPESEPLKYGEKYWIADPTHTCYTLTYEWAGYELDKSILAKGLLHRSRENAIAHAKALIELSGGKL
ncbi:hypothetical protein LU276_08150 [Moraxella haemolytica]|uniref:hypothetical protein n=1 Tax=Moraxella haemolytica TaxID=2904119 RepID=UPI002543976D|nr:hypothetical protein [Moraxella sp. ZY171148]WII94971.1 hypothetical protein LU276_08150 [Moraxella sp. ZY171148]